MIQALKLAGPLLASATGFLLLAGLAKAAVDIMSQQPDNNIFIRWGAWFDIRTSWKRKYKDYDGGDLSARYWRSKDVLVAGSDFWHFADFLYLKFYLVGSGLGFLAVYRAALGTWGYVGFVCWSALVLGAVFEVFYGRVFRIVPKLG